MIQRGVYEELKALFTDGLENYNFPSFLTRRRDALKKRENFIKVAIYPVPRVGIALL